MSVYEIGFFMACNNRKYLKLHLYGRKLWYEAVE